MGGADVSAWLFRAEVMPLVYGLAQIALTPTCSPSASSSRRRCSSGRCGRRRPCRSGILAPFALGVGAGVLLHQAGGFFSESMTAPQAGLFLGASLAITAFPVMARIIHERGLTGTAIGTMALAAGAMDDVAAWLIFAVVVASFKHDAMVAIVAFGGALGYAALVFGPLRPYLRRLAREADGRRGHPVGVRRHPAAADAGRLVHRLGRRPLGLRRLHPRRGGAAAG